MSPADWMQRAFLACLSVSALAGCGKVYVLQDGQTFAHESRGLDAGFARLPFAACIVPNLEGEEGRILVKTARHRIAEVVEKVLPAGSPDCDILVTVASRKQWRWDVSSARSGRLLFTVRGQPGAGSNLEGWMKRAFCERLAPGTPAHAALLADRTLAPRSTAAVRPPAPVEPARAASAPSLPPPAWPNYRSQVRPNDFAVVVGVETYSDLPAALYAERDSQAVRAHLEALGVPPRNIISLSGSKAGRAALEKYLEDWLPKLAREDSRIYFYFSGHGAPDPISGEAYLMPWDADPNYLDRTAYSLKRLYADLGRTKAREVFVALDTCFSGAGGRSVLPRGARPLVTKIAMPALARSLTVLTASDSNEISGALDEKGHGAFTYFLLEGLNGHADGFTASQLHSHLSPLVQDEARRLNRQQTPQLQGDGALRLR